MLVQPVLNSFSLQAYRSAGGERTPNIRGQLPDRVELQQRRPAAEHDLPGRQYRAGGGGGELPIPSAGRAQEHD